MYDGEGMKPQRRKNGRWESREVGIRKVKFRGILSDIFWAESC